MKEQENRWIAVDVESPKKPHVLRLMQDIGCTNAAAFEIYFKLCAWFDANAKDGVVNADKIMIDTLANRFGCANSLEKSGWLSFDGETCTITTWQKDADFQIW